MALISDRLEHLIQEMDERGIRFEEAVREFEKRFIARVLGRCAGNLTRAADVLGIHRNTLTRKLAAYRLSRRA